MSHEVRSQQGVDKLTIRIQFDPAALPSLIWHYAGSKGVGMKRPEGVCPISFPFPSLVTFCMNS